MTIDRRVQRTRQLLRDSLMSLILEKGYDAITIQEITDRANLGRATFYLHYRDKEDLLVNSLEAIFDELKRLVEKPDGALDLGASQPPVVIAFRHASENADLYRVIFSGQGAARIFLRIKEYLQRVLRKHLEDMLPAGTYAIPLDVTSAYMAGAMFSLIEWWLLSDMPYSPEEMAGMFRQLCWPGIRLAAAGSTAAMPLGGYHLTMPDVPHVQQEE